jgi:hypothetical protein
MTRVRILEDTNWYSKQYRRGEIATVCDEELFDLLMARRAAILEGPGCAGAGGGRESNLLPRIEGIHRGELILVLGNGPSASEIGRHRNELSGVTTIGVNRILSLFEPTYLLFLDMKVWLTDRDLIQKSRAIKFCSDRIPVPFFNRFARYRSKTRDDVLSDSYATGLFWSRSSVVPAVNLAYLFGASAIALIGVDLNNSSHFYDKCGRDSEFLHRDEILEHLYIMSRALIQRNVACYDCSPSGKVRGFQKVELTELLARAKWKGIGGEAGASKGSYQFAAADSLNNPAASQPGRVATVPAEQGGEDG